MFNLQLKKLREEQNMSQRALAKVFGLSPSTIGMWESGRREPDFSMINQIADHFGVTADFLLGRNENGTIGFDDFTYAMYREGKTLTPESKKKLLELARFFREQEAK